MNQNVYANAQVNEEAIKEQALKLCEILYNKKALDIMAIHVGDKTIIADWFVICSGRATAQVKALCDEVEEKSAELALRLGVRKDIPREDG